MDWTAQRILRELCDEETQKQVLETVWLSPLLLDVATQINRMIAARLKTRPSTIAKWSSVDKARLMHKHRGMEMDESGLTVILSEFLRLNRNEMIQKFMDMCGIENEKGAYEGVVAPTPEIAARSAQELKAEYPAAHIRAYLATAWLVNKPVDQWRAACEVALQELDKERVEKAEEGVVQEGVEPADERELDCAPEPALEPATEPQQPKQPVEALSSGEIEEAEGGERETSIRTEASDLGAEDAPRTPVIEATRAAMVLTQGPKDLPLGFIDSLVEKGIRASVNEDSVALSRDDAWNAVEELIRLNGDRPQSYIHKGFLAVRTGRDCDALLTEESFPGLGWLLAGMVSALYNQSKYSEISRLYDLHPDTFKAVLVRQHHCAAILMPKLFEALWEGEREEEGVAFLSPRILVMAQSLPVDQGRLSPVEDLLRRAGDAYRRRRVPLVRQLVKVLTKVRELSPTIFSTDQELTLGRRHAQVLKAEGRFDEAIASFGELARSGAGTFTADILTDIGLCKGKFKWLKDIEVPRSEDDIADHLDRLLLGYDEFLSAKEQPEGQAMTNTCFVMGVVELLSSRDKGNLHEARVLLEKAHAGAINSETTYRLTWVMPIIELYTALVNFADLNSDQAKHSMELLKKCKEDIPTSEWPEWLVKRAAKACFDTGMPERLELLAFISENFPHLIPEVAMDEKLAIQSELLRSQLFKIAEASDHNASQRFRAAKVAASVSRDLNNAQEHETALDLLEVLAVQNPALRSEYLAYLGTDTNYSPGWEWEDAARSRAKIAEGVGDPQAITILSELAHSAITRGREHEVEGLLDRMKKLGAIEADLSQIQARVSACRDSGSSQRLTATRDISGFVMYIGGNEVQARLRDRIRQGVREHFSNVDVVFELTKWSSNIGGQFKSFEGRIERSKAVVMCSMMRTNMGRKVRGKCNEAGLTWRTHTGTGAESAIRTILDALRDL